MSMARVGVMCVLKVEVEIGGGGGLRERGRDLEKGVLCW
jgi:hypothetical protein